MLDVLTPSQQMFMLFFSILYGIMLNSLLGLGAFPIAQAIAWVHASLRKRVKGKRVFAKSRNRLILSFVLFHILPFVYFGITFYFIGDIVGDFPSANLCHAISQIVFIGLLSLGVFAFHRFFSWCVLLKRYGNPFYTPYDLKRKILEKIHPNAWTHFGAGILYLVIPWLVFIVFLS